MDHEKYVEQVTTYPTTVTHISYFTDTDGYLILPQNLKIGHYRIEEVTAPDGYTINKNYVEIQVDTNTLYQTDPVSGDAIIEVVYENHPVKGKLTVQKKERFFRPIRMILSMKFRIFPVQYMKCMLQRIFIQLISRKMTQEKES